MRFGLAFCVVSILLLLASAIGCKKPSGPAGLSAPRAELAATATHQTQPDGSDPVIEEYRLLDEARDRLPALSAIAELETIIASRPHSPAASEAHLALARYYASTGDPAAQDEYREAIGLENSVGLRLELAIWLEGRGEVDAAYDEYALLLPRYPQAFRDMRRVGTDSLQTARDLMDAAYYSDALEELRGLEEPAAVPIRGQALSGLGRHEEAASLFDAWLSIHPEDVDARMGLARSLAAQELRDEALELYETVDSPESTLAQAELWTVEDPSRAISLYLECELPIALWQATALLEAQGRLTETIPLYVELGGSRTKWADDAAYRVHILADRLGESAARQWAHDWLTNDQPNYFALRLGGEWTPPVGLPLRPSGRIVLSKTEALEAMGEEVLGYRELTLAARFDRRAEAQAAYAQALSDRGHLLEAQRIAETLLWKLPRPPLSLWRLAYPQPYSREVRASAEEFDLDPLLLWSVMHTESRYDPEALSSARAQGLMQIIPSTAEWAAESAGFEFTPLDIYDPDANLRMAAWYVRWLLDYFGNDLELAVTAYNGGPGNVNAWNDQVTNRDDYFRWIGAGESREYVNLVMTTYHVYQELERISSE